jgi:hypothetical protein
MSNKGYENSLASIKSLFCSFVILMVQPLEIVANQPFYKMGYLNELHYGAHNTRKHIPIIRPLADWDSSSEKKMITSISDANIVTSLSFILLVHVTTLKSNGIYFSTDTKMDPNDVLQYYHSPFQIEFLYRDAKQHTGLCDSQARSENKLHFQFNASLTSINIAKVVHWLSIPKEKRGAFSMSDIKTMNHNILMINRIFDVFGICPYSIKNQNYVKELILVRHYGRLKFNELLTLITN